MSLITPDGGLLFWMVLIFGIVFFILAKWGFPVITSMVRKRNEHINDALKMARAAEQRLGNLAQEQARMIEETRAEQSRILKEAAASRDEIIAQAQEQARGEAARIMAQTKVELEAEKESAMRDIRKQVALLSMSVAEKVLRKDLSREEGQLELIGRLSDELTSDGKDGLLKN